MPVRAFITGVSGLALTPQEQEFLREAEPWGLILFARNIQEPGQVRALVDDFRNVVGRADAPVLVDQEGGRVQRLRPPHWPSYPPGAAYGRLYDRDRLLGMKAARCAARMIAADLAALGITVDCLPLADVPTSEADPIIGDRAYGDAPAKVAAIAAVVADGLMDGGVLPVLKHLPGHGRATADSHENLPIVDAPRSELNATDFAAFRPLNNLPLGMTAHVVYTAIDPDRCATISPTLIRDVIRGAIGFDGALMSDDISMKALSGTMAERTWAALAAGCDLVLHCNGRMEEMQEIGAHAPVLCGDALRRAQAALAARRPALLIDIATARAEFSAMMSANQVAGSASAPTA